MSQHFREGQRHFYFQFRKNSKKRMTNQKIEKLIKQKKYEDAIRELKYEISSFHAEDDQCLLSPYNARISYCLFKLERNAEASQYASHAIKQDSKNIMAIGVMARSLFALERYEEAKTFFLRLDSDDDGNHSPVKKFIRKCDAEIDSQKQEKEEEFPKEEKEEKIPEMTKKKKERLPFGYDCHQTRTEVIINFFVKDSEQKNVEFEVSEKSLELSIRISEHRELQISFDLWAPVKPSSMKKESLSDKIIITLEKKNPNVRWISLEEEEDKKGTIHNFTKTNWDKFISNQPEEKLEGDAATNKFFEKLYGNGKDEQKRAMIKSFTESGGSVLSTDWKDIGSRKVEGSAPDGMEMKTWKQTQLGE